MCYTNVRFDLRKVFEAIVVTEVAIPKTKKQKNIDKKKLRAPPGAIISMHFQKHLRGVNLRKMKKYHCPRCRLMSSKDKPVHTVGVVYRDRPVHNHDKTCFADTKRPCKKIGFRRGSYPTLEWYCDKCKRTYEPELIGRKRIDNFLNQTTFVLFLKQDHYVNIMLFKNSFKIAGCKTNQDAVTAVATVWERLQLGDWTLTCEDRPYFIFEVVMRNVGFNLGFGIDRTLLNLLMNQPEFSDKVAMSQFEPTGQTNVNIKMHSSKPAGFMYDCLVYPPPPPSSIVPAKTVEMPPAKMAGGPETRRAKVDSIRVDEFNHCTPLCPCAFLNTAGRHNPTQPFLMRVPMLFFKLKYKEEKPVTFIVFSSSQTILSGKYDANVKERYQFFIDTLLKHKERIRERLDS